MRVILLSCLLYLLGVVLILYLKPTLMFDKKGIWKEFGFTNDETHTWFPFWLFCILWAFISFFIVNFIFGEKQKSVTSVTILDISESDNQLLPLENTNTNWIESVTGVKRDEPATTKKNVEAALNEPSGVRVVDPVTQVERELTNGELLRHRNPDLFAEKAKAAEEAANAPAEETTEGEAAAESTEENTEA
jgi:hypothetical protein